jgi:hypothetical protein
MYLNPGAIASGTPLTNFGCAAGSDNPGIRGAAKARCNRLNLVARSAAPVLAPVNFKNSRRETMFNSFNQLRNTKNL